MAWSSNSIHIVKLSLSLPHRIQLQSKSWFCLFLFTHTHGLSSPLVITVTDWFLHAYLSSSPLQDLNLSYKQPREDLPPREGEAPSPCPDQQPSRRRRRGGRTRPAWDSGTGPAWDSGTGPAWDSGTGPAWDAGTGPAWDAGDTGTGQGLQQLQFRRGGRRI